MRVAMIIQSYHPHIGGAERQLAAIAPRMVAAGIDVHILTRRYDPSLAPFEEIGGIPVYRLPTPGSKAVASLSFTLAAQAHMLRWRPDIVHAHELLSPTTTAILAKRLFGIPIAAKVVTGGEYGDIQKLATRATGGRRLDAALRYVDRFIAISDEIRQELSAVGVSSAQQTMIPNGVDTERFTVSAPDEKRDLRHKFTLVADGPIITFCGRLTPQKCLANLIEVWPAVRNSQPNATLLIAGTGELEASLKAQAGEGVRFLGRVDDVAPVLNLSDLFVLPSAAEGLSNAMLEAMACGLPVLATNVGGTSDVLEHQQNGWLIAPDSPDELRAGLLGALRKLDSFHDMGVCARQRVLGKYSLASVVTTLSDLYNELCHAHRSSHRSG